MLLRKISGARVALLLGVLAATAQAADRPAAPNVIMVLMDDLGFAQFGCFGAPLATPNIDRVAAAGVRYNNFHVAPVCSPTRAALLTGRNPHAVGVACITEFANGEPNSRGGIRPDAGTVADYLRAAGYSTAAIGKWHLTPMTELNPAAPPTHWPTGRGFDHFYGFTSGETNPWAPELFSDRERLKSPPTKPDGSPLHSEVDLVNHAIGFIAEQRAVKPTTPFFLYLAFSAGHAPHQAPPEYLAKWRGKFDRGWDVAREETLARQKALGVVPPDTQLPPRNPGIKAWADLSADEQRLYARYYETFAAFVEHTDAQLGRLLDFLERTGQRDNTLVIVGSDNGASPEGGPEGMWNEVRLFTSDSNDKAADGLRHFSDLGTALAYPTYPTGWTMAGNTPFKRTKGTTHEGGSRTPLVMSWPARIKPDAAVRPQFHDVVDLLPTILEAAGTPPPKVLDGRTQTPLAGTSMAYTWSQPAAPSHRTAQYVEIYGNRAIYENGWKAVTFHTPGTRYENDTWELYDLAHDFNETRDLAKAQPQKLAELLVAWEREAKANDVYPLDDRRGARELMLPAGSPPRASHFEFFPPVSGVHKGSAPDLRKRSWTLTAEFGESAAPPSGVIAAFGGRFAGWSLYAHDNRLIFHYNYAGIERSAVMSDLEIGHAKQVGVSFTLDPRGGADIALSIDGREVGRSRVPHVMLTISHETFDVGCDLFTPVCEDYASPANFTGALRRVVLDADPFQN